MLKLNLLYGMMQRFRLIIPNEGKNFMIHWEINYGMKMVLLFLILAIAYQTYTTDAKGRFYNRWHCQWIIL